MKHKVVVSESVTRIVEVEAKSGEEAVETVKQRCQADMENLPPNVNWNLDVCLLVD